MFIPIGRDNAVVRRHPFVTYTIIALNVVVFIALIAASKVEQESERATRDAWLYLVAHPYLEVPPALKDFVTREVQEDLRRLTREGYAPGVAERVGEQAALNERALRIEELARHRPSLRFGYVPGRGAAWSMITYAFLHAGLVHLLGNLLFLFVTGPFLEDVFGRAIFTLLYLSGAVVAALGFAAQNRGVPAPLVGASGAVAALMGAYLVRFAKSKIEFIWIPFGIRFFVPALVFLPFWFAKQLFLSPYEGAAGVAFSAHIAGFMYGAVAALVIYVSGAEKKWITPAVEGATTWTENARVVSAMDARSGGDLGTARRRIETVLRSEPANLTALQESMEIAAEASEWDYFSAQAAKLVDAYARNGQTDMALQVGRQAIDVAGEDLDPKVLMKIAAQAERSNETNWALDLYEEAARRQGDDPVRLRSLLHAGRLHMRRGDRPAAETAFDRARRSTHFNSEWEQAITEAMKLRPIER